MSSQPPFVSVIIPVYNDHEGLRATLSALTHQTYPPQCYEILVVDNGSDSPPADLVASCQSARLLTERKAGSYAARNCGVEAAVGEILAFTDAGCIPERGWIERGVARLLLHPDAGLVGGRFRITCMDPARPTSAELYELLTAFNQEAYVNRAKFSCTGNMFTHRDVLKRVDSFDSSLKSGGDLEWGRRVHGAGLQLIYAEDVVVEHPARATMSELCKKQRRRVGGLYDLARLGHVDANPVVRRTWLSVLGLFIPDFRSSAGLACDPRLSGVTHRVTIAALDLLIQLVGRAEEIRLRLGRTSKRT